MKAYLDVGLSIDELGTAGLVLLVAILQRVPNTCSDHMGMCTLHAKPVRPKEASGHRAGAVLLRKTTTLLSRREDCHVRTLYVSWKMGVMLPMEKMKYDCTANNSQHLQDCTQNPGRKSAAPIQGRAGDANTSQNIPIPGSAHDLTQKKNDVSALREWNLHEACHTTSAAARSLRLDDHIPNSSCTWGQLLEAR
jgi:hypothetical protein